MSWEIEHHREAPSVSHARPVPPGAPRSAWIFEPTVAAVVLGSTQSTAVVDHGACVEAGVEIVQRGSGGGAVLVRPGEILWVDIVVPAGDPLWDDDVGRSFAWLGTIWQAALGDLGVTAVPHRGAMRRPRWSGLVCFAGLGPGELSAPGGAKVVGISQRRTRRAARFQCAVPSRWEPAELLGLLALSPAARRRAAEDLRDAVEPPPVGAPALAEALIRRLPRSRGGA